MLDFYTRSQVSYMRFLIFSILCLTASIYRNTVLHRALAFLHVIWSEPQADFCSILSFEGCSYGKQAWKMEAVSPLEQWIYILLSIMKDLGSLFRDSSLVTKPTACANVSSVQLLSHVWPFVTPWITAHQASLSITNSWSLLKLMPIESVMPSRHLILCHPLLLLPPIPPRIRVFSNESTLRMRWPKYWSFSFSVSPSNEHPGLISFRIDGWISLQSKGLSRVFSNTTVQKHQFFGAQLSSQSNSHIHTWPLEKP